MKNNRNVDYVSDGTEADLLLAEKLRKFKNDRRVVLAVPRDGVPVAHFFAKELGFPIAPSK